MYNSFLKSLIQRGFLMPLPPPPPPPPTTTTTTTAAAAEEAARAAAEEAARAAAEEAARAAAEEAARAASSPPPQLQSHNDNIKIYTSIDGNGVIHISLIDLNEMNKKTISLRQGDILCIEKIDTVAAAAATGEGGAKINLSLSNLKDKMINNKFLPNNEYIIQTILKKFFNFPGFNNKRKNNINFFMVEKYHVDEKEIEFVSVEFNKKTYTFDKIFNNKSRRSVRFNHKSLKKLFQENDVKIIPKDYNRFQQVIKKIHNVIKKYPNEETTIIQNYLDNKTPLTIKNQFKSLFTKKIKSRREEKYIDFLNRKYEHFLTEISGRQAATTGQGRHYSRQPQSSQAVQSLSGNPLHNPKLFKTLGGGYKRKKRTNDKKKLKKKARHIPKKYKVKL